MSDTPPPPHPATDLVGSVARFDALEFTRAYRSAQIITSDDESRPALTGVYVEIFDGVGARMVATDSYALIITWAGWAGTTTDLLREQEPDLDEAPDWAVTILDNEGVLAKVVAVITKHATAFLKAGLEPPTLELTIADKPEITQGCFDGLTPVVAQLRYGPVVDAAGAIYEGEYPPWRTLVRDTGRDRGRGGTDAIQLTAGILGRVCSAAQIMGETIRWDFTGRNKPVAFTVEPVDDENTNEWKARARSKAGCHGLLIPVHMRDELAAITLVPVDDPAPPQ